MMPLWKIKNRVRWAYNSVFKTECPACDGTGGYHNNYYEPPDYCGYCNCKGLVGHYRAFEWKFFIEKNLLPPSDWLSYVWNHIIYTDCPAPHDPMWWHYGCQVCNSDGRVTRWNAALYRWQIKSGVGNGIR